MGILSGLKKSLIGEKVVQEKKRAPESPKPASESTAAASTKPVSVGNYRPVKVEKGMRGWGGPLIINPRPGKDLIYSVTGGGIHPVAQKIADMTGGKPFDGFRSKAGFEEIAVAVVDCGGTARVGVYPMKNVLTIDVHAASPAGPLMKFIREDNFVSGVSVKTISYAD